MRIVKGVGRTPGEGGPVYVKESECCSTLELTLSTPIPNNLGTYLMSRFPTVGEYRVVTWGYQFLIFLTHALLRSATLGRG